MPLDKRNLNDPDLYAPRETPKVSRAELRYELDAPGEDAPRVAEPYRYDEPEGWDTPLERLTVGERPSRRKPIDAGNPYAKPKKVGRRKKGGADGSGGHPVLPGHGASDLPRRHADRTTRGAGPSRLNGRRRRHFCPRVAGPPNTRLGPGRLSRGRSPAPGRSHGRCPRARRW